MKIAFASSDGSAVDRHFGLAEAFYLWEIDPERAVCIGRVDCGVNDDDQEDKINSRVNSLEGCTLVYSLQIGGPAAAKLVARHIHPLKTATEAPVAELATKLQQILQGRPPPWLSKAMGVKQERSLSMQCDDE
jgi:nitrogen fixation protein NifX